MRAYLICAAAMLVACTETVTEYVEVPANPANKISITATAGTRFVEDIDIRIESDIEGQMIWIGRLPFTFKAQEGDSLTAHFHVNVSNFTLNHPQCSCETQYGGDCHEPYIVTGDTLWEIAL